MAASLQWGCVSNMKSELMRCKNISTLLLIVFLSMCLPLIHVSGKVRNLELNETPFRLQDGDLIFQRSSSQLGPVFEIVLGSKITHVGVVFIENDSAFVYEAKNKVTKTELDRWISRGVGRQFAAMRLRNADSLLTENTLAEIRRELDKHVGKPYDTRFKWSDDRMYSTELVYKAFERGADIKLGRIERFGDFKFDDKLVKFWIDMYFPDGPNLDERVITPISIFYDTKLETIFTTMPERGSIW